MTRPFCYGILACIAAVATLNSASAFITTRLIAASPTFASTYYECHRQQTRVASIESAHDDDDISDTSSSLRLTEDRRRLLSSHSRRSILSSSLLASITAILTTSSSQQIAAFAAETNTDSLIADLDTSLERISTIPPLLEAAQWDKVRTILKTPPVVDLWNLGDSKNTLAKIALSTGNMEIMEYKDELSISLQMTDQYSYDNNFIYYQPGNGKVKTKEPLDMANKAIVQLKEAVEFVKSNK